MIRQLARAARPALRGLIVALCVAQAVPAADQMGGDAAAPELEGSAALVAAGQTAPLLESTAQLIGIADLRGGWQATWLLPAEYSRSINGVDVLQVRPDIYMLTVGGENIVVQTGWQGTLVIDSGSAEHCDALVAAVKALAKSPIRFIVNTSADTGRIGCNRDLAEVGHAFTEGVQAFAAPIIATQNALQQLILQPEQSYAAVELPSEIFTRPVRNMTLNDQAVQVFAMPEAHTNGDTMVLFRRSDVVVAGSIMDMNSFPVIDLEHGGSINGEIAALNRLLSEFAVPMGPKWQRPGGTLVIPGRGRLCVQTDVLNYRDMVTIVRDRVQALLDQGKSFEQVLAARPARGYERRYGSESGSWTTRHFIEAVYKSLKVERSSRKQAREKK